MLLVLIQGIASKLLVLILLVLIQGIASKLLVLVRCILNNY